MERRTYEGAATKHEAMATHKATTAQEARQRFLRP